MNRLPKLGEDKPSAEGELMNRLLKLGEDCLHRSPNAAAIAPTMLTGALAGEARS